MPELPEVETIVRGLRERILGQRILTVEIYYSKIIINGSNFFFKNVSQQVVFDITRLGKYIFIHLQNHKIIVLHLRMTGQLFFTHKKDNDKHVHLEFRFKSLTQTLVYRDVRKFGRFELIGQKEYENYVLKKGLAQDALQMDEDTLFKNLSKKKKCLKASLLDQKVIAGLGNIYVDEVLHKERLSPLAKSCDLTKEEVGSLLATIKNVLQQAILAQGTTFSDYVTASGIKGRYQLELEVYKQEGKPCCRCQTSICKIKVAGRGTY